MGEALQRPLAVSGNDLLGPISASPQYVAEALVDFASLTSLDTLFDLGCNDGRIVITAARLTAAKGVGIEVDTKAAAKAQQAVVNGKRVMIFVAADGKLSIS